MKKKILVLLTAVMVVLLTSWTVVAETPKEVTVVNTPEVTVTNLPAISEVTVTNFPATSEVTVTNTPLPVTIEGQNTPSSTDPSDFYYGDSHTWGFGGGSVTTRSLEGQDVLLTDVHLSIQSSVSAEANVGVCKGHMEIAENCDDSHPPVCDLVAVLGTVFASPRHISEQRIQLPNIHVGGTQYFRFIQDNSTEDYCYFGVDYRGLKM